MDFPFSMISYFFRAPFCICLALRQVPHHCFPHFHCVFLSFHCVYKHAWFVSLKWSHFDPFCAIFFITSTVKLEWFSGATVFEMLAWHRMGLWHSGKINMLSDYEPSPVLIRALPLDTSASLHQDKNSLLSSVHYDDPAVLVGLQVVQWFPASLELHQQWRHEKKLVRRWGRYPG